MADFEDLEILVAKIQRQLAPGAKVSHNAKIMGRHTEVMRQIDVLVEQNVGQYTMSVVIDSKDHKVPVDVKGVEEFHGLVDDVRAQKGVMVCPAGFTPAAKNRALGLQIDLYSPVDTDPHKWTAKVSIPVVCDYRSAAIAFGISCSAPYPFTLQADFLSKLTAYDANGTELGTIFGAAIKRWNKGDYPMEPGEYDDLPIFDSEVVLVDKWARKASSGEGLGNRPREQAALLRRSIDRAEIGVQEQVVRRRDHERLHHWHPRP